ncbi:uncharacterized protein MELLADRAFT_95898 [Melampsora larici-populina 98AG31]|uniref:Uncharacterized protein n=1 Tax=Melampsora larici-populina (strain 98AG31 / pathotype 3-4-7) TaxID=747676 RepID=F4RDN9_MELLP|nr:uncharacterized protein MELLADRAFT_95898 [Melampsora larici-populina 98AG31]EGG09430.1 hypothetical protein MELLADRAFT_95898 [Melampsora larici-populina 98AG31]
MPTATAPFGGGLPSLKANNIDDCTAATTDDIKDKHSPAQSSDLDELNINVQESHDQLDDLELDHQTLVPQPRALDNLNVGIKPDPDIMVPAQSSAVDPVVRPGNLKIKLLVQKQALDPLIPVEPTTKRSVTVKAESGPTAAQKRKAAAAEKRKAAAERRDLAKKKR